MKAKIELVQMIKHVARDTAYGLLSHIREDGVAEFLEDGRTHTGEAVCGVR